MNGKATLTKDLITSLKEGSAFYEEVLRAGVLPDLEDLLHTLVEVREVAVLHVAQLPEADKLIIEAPGTLGPKLRQLSAKAKALLGEERDAYISELVYLEKHNLAQLTRVAEALTSAEDKVVLDKIVRKFRETVAIMESVRHSRAE
ncbi:MAG: hypothetical protein HKN11_18510 [Rhizobiales bacterium]|nr:hypothetical protein [Hyphomicrobiales bacterium]